jgi:hypothetical protein
MPRRLLLWIVLAAGSTLPVFADEPVTLKICAGGDATVYVARVVYVQSLLFGNSYHAAGWYRVDPGDCKVVYDSDEAKRNPVYLAYAYNDAGGVLRNMKPPDDPGLVKGNPEALRSVREKFCVQPGVAFQYKADTKEEAQKCKPGFTLANFIDSFDPAGYTSGTQTVTVGAKRDFRQHPALTIGAMTAHLIFGDEVHLDEGGQWRYASGSAIATDLIVKKTGLPVLLPKRQYSTSQSPVQGYLKEIKDVMNSAQPCTDTSVLNTHYSAFAFDLDDSGVVVASDAASLFGSNPITSKYGAALANLDLSGENLQSRGECYLVSFVCKDRGQCVRLGDSATVNWSLFVNTRQQGERIVNALRAIAPYYPDGEGEIH